MAGRIAACAPRESSSASPPPPPSARWAIFGKLAYDEGATVGTLLAVRFAIAAIAVLGAGARAPARSAGCAPIPRRDVGIAVALGALGYSAQAGCYFAAARAASTPPCSRCVLYTFPAIVTVAAIVLGRERASRRTAAALLLASVGLVLVLAGAATGALDPLGTALGLAAAVIYATYILSSEGIAGRRRPAPAERARLHRRGRHAHAGRAAPSAICTRAT